MKDLPVVLGFIVDCRCLFSTSFGRFDQSVNLLLMCRRRWIYHSAWRSKGRFGMNENPLPIGP